MAETVDRTLEIENAEPLLLFGFNDLYLRKIEDAYRDTRIVARGSRLHLRGPADELDRIERVVGELTLILNRNGTLTENDVATVLDLASVSAGARPGPGADAILFTASGGTVKAKTPGQTQLVEAARQNDIVFAMGPAGTGKCVAADTLVLTGGGLVPIGELAAGTAPGASLPRQHEVASMHGLTPTSHVYNGGRSRTLTLATDHGFEVEGTPEHPLLVMTPEGVYEWRRMDAIQPGDYVGLQRGAGVFGTESAVDYRYVRKPTGGVSREVYLDRLDRDFAYFMGLVVGDGHLRSADRGTGGALVMVSTGDAEVGAHVEATCGRFGLRAPRHGYDYRIGSVQLHGLLRHLGVAEAPAHEKHVPESVLRAPRAQAVAFLQGLFDADGTVSQASGAVSLSSSSPRLAREVQVMLLNLGLVATRRVRTTARRDSHRLTLYGAEADRFFDVVGFRLPRKQALRQRPRNRNPNADVVPGVAGLIDAAVRTRRFTRAEHKRLYDYRTGRRRPSYAALHAVLEHFAESDAQPVRRLRRIADDHLLWSRVASLTPGEADVYDLTVPDGHHFIANGFVSHNTYTGVALAVSALKSRQVKKIVLCRPAVEAGESLGFLPGDLRDKVDPYLRPLYDALEEMVPPQKLRAYMEQNVVEILPLAFMRGRTLNSAFVILDEAQNATGAQMKMFLTRIGTGSRAIVTGDVTQTDLPSRSMSGLVQARDVLEGVGGIAFIDFGREDVVRHKLVKDIIAAYDRASGE